MSSKKHIWTLINSKRVYKNPWIEVREDKVVKYDGKLGLYGIVTMKPGITVLPMNRKGEIFLVEQYRYALKKTTIEAISGGIEGKESHLESAKRELQEEAGIKAKKWISLGMVDPLTSVVNSPNYLFLAKDLSFVKATPDGTEDIKVIKVSLKQAVNWVIKGLITDSVAATLIFKAKNLL